MDWDSTPTQLKESVWEFPPSHKWPANDVVGRGGDLSPETLIYAYQNGIFPMVTNDEFEDQEAMETYSKVSTMIFVLFVSVSS